MSSSRTIQSDSGVTTQAAESLLEIVYMSSTVTAAFPETALGDILASSRRRNAGLGVTGVLLYQAGTFVQLLEGPPEAVRHLYQDRIQADSRHRGFVTC